MDILRKRVCVLFLLVLMTSNVLAFASADKSNITWNQSETATISAIGIGLPPENADTSAQAKMLARRAGIVDAYRNLLEVIENINVDSETTMKNLMIADDTVKIHVNGIIHGAKIKDEKYLTDGSYQVTLEMNLFGQNSLASIAMEKIAPTAVQPIPAPTQDIALPDNTQGAYVPTGVIVDARDLGLEATFSPGIYDENGRPIYGSKNIDPDFAVKYGMVDYASTPDLVREAITGQSRAGSHPILIKAIALKSGNQSVIISRLDAEKILAANQNANFLNRCAVVFLK